MDKVYLIHSVDSLRLAEEISREAVKKQVEVNILIEVNVGTGREQVWYHNRRDRKTGSRYFVFTRCTY